MDPFAERMLEKARQRCKNLGIKTDFNVLSEFQEMSNSLSTNCVNTPVKTTLSTKRSKSGNDTTNSPEPNLGKTFISNKENLGIAINVRSDHRIEMVQIQLQDENGLVEEETLQPEEDKEKPKIRDCSRNRLKRLGALYSNSDEISSPIHRTENQFYEEKNDHIIKDMSNKKVTHKLNKLAELAKEINNWEDEDVQKRTKNNFNDHKIETTNERQNENEVTKKLKWDNTVMQNLEAQGFQRKENNSNVLSFEYLEKIDRKQSKNNEIENTSSVQKVISKINAESKGNTSLTGFNKPNLCIKSNYKDPIDLPLKERMKIFEQNKGEAPVPKVPFGMNVPAKKVCDEAVKEHKMLNMKVPQNKLELKNYEAALNCSKPGKIESEIEQKINNIQKHKHIQMETDLEKNRVENSISKKIVQGNLSTIVSQFENKIINNANNEDEHQSTKISPKRLYPNLSEFESNNETESGTDGNEYSTEILSEEEPVRKSFRKSIDSSIDDARLSLNTSSDSFNFEKPQVRFELPETKRSYVYNKSNNAESDSNISNNSTSSQATDNSEEVSDYLNDAFDDDEDNENDDNSSLTTNTDSIIKGGNTGNTSLNNNINQLKSQLSVEESKENMVTLVHTISFYRKQQNNTSNPSTPIRKICREQEIRREISEESETSENDDGIDYDQREIETRLVKEKMAKLRDEVCKQQQIIAQTSQALNLCAATIEFSGSTEAVEGERHLLVATHRRQAALDEIQRLRVEGVVRPSGSPKERGRLTVKEITIPLRQDYIRKLSNDAISGHHLLCLLKYNETVLATQTVPTLPGLLSVKFPDVLNLNEVYADFRVTLEIYGMTAQREILPHEIKYHININKNKNARTPKKKGSDSRLVMPIVQSPAGPNVVRTPALVQYGFAIFSLREVQRNTWTLTKVSGVSPLEGTVHMKINCELSVSISYKGFLTMFEDISGFGAWHRRWCYLNGHILNYWKYPDDEKKCTPIGSIDLNMAITQKITTAPREICARLNTIMLECKTSSKEDALTRKSSLMTVTKNDMVVLRYLLSADTKEERDEWCAHLNKALMLLRAWSSN
ncbi:anillin [Condylostylus longicornis]|uniref:anillin n=1 Tax=Condylostylus longicornis TaxID=2530218 RepID=UPI00244DB4E4|nr:anillin [Condylostylus longicornis]